MQITISRSVVLLCAISCAGCERPGETRMRLYGHESCDAEKLSEFIIRCAEAANPKSDEEGEDLVKQCEWTGRKVHCKTVLRQAIHRRRALGTPWKRIGEPMVVDEETMQQSDR